MVSSQLTHEKPRRGLAIASLVLGLLGIPTLGILGVGAIVGIVLGIAALVKARNYPAEYGGKGLAIGGIIANGLALLVGVPLAIIAAIAIPSLLRARVSANEAAALGDIRTVISAEVAYASANGGFYDELRCLEQPAQCIPGYPTSSPNFLYGELASLAPKSGYTRTFHPGPAPTQEEIGSSNASPSSTRSFAYVAVPTEPGKTGVRAFCGDDSGIICQTSDGSHPAVAEGRCGQPCTTVQ